MAREPWPEDGIFAQDDNILADTASIFDDEGNEDTDNPVVTGEDDEEIAESPQAPPAPQPRQLLPPAPPVEVIAPPAARRGPPAQKITAVVGKDGKPRVKTPRGWRVPTPAEWAVLQQRGQLTKLGNAPVAPVESPARKAFMVIGAALVVGGAVYWWQKAQKADEDRDEELDENTEEV